jgi:hypothetical protein
VRALGQCSVFPAGTFTGLRLVIGYRIQRRDSPLRAGGRKLRMM